MNVVKTSRDRAVRLPSEIYSQIRQLGHLAIATLQIRYKDLLGEEPRSSRKQFLIRRIAWQMQAAVYGDLNERARRRIADITPPVRLSPPNDSSDALQTPVHFSNRPRDVRLPPPGSLIRRKYQGREIIVRVLENGFECDSEHYSSLSALARHLTGTRWNGLLFFGLTERRHG